MPKLQTLLDHYINSSLHVATAVVALVFVTANQFQSTLDYSIYGTVFFATVVGYNTIKFGNLDGKKKRFFFNQYSLLTYSFAGLFFLSSLFFPVQQQLILVCVSLMVFFYAFPIYSGGKNIRNRKKVKIYWVAFVWSLFTVIFPVSDVFLEGKGLAVLAHRFVFVFCATLPFEIRDLATDPNSLRTWPQRFGVWKTRILGILLVVIASLFLFCWSVEDQIVTLVIHLLLAGCILGADTKQSKYYASFFVESIPLLWALLGVLI